MQFGVLGSLQPAIPDFEDLCPVGEPIHSGDAAIRRFRHPVITNSIHMQCKSNSEFNHIEFNQAQSSQVDLIQCINGIESSRS